MTPALEDLDRIIATLEKNAKTWKGNPGYLRFLETELWCVEYVRNQVVNRKETSMSELKTPGVIAEHAPKYNPDAWKEWTPSELGLAVAFFIKRAGHRANPEKKAKDLLDAQNYLEMMQAHINAAKAD